MKFSLSTVRGLVMAAIPAMTLAAGPALADGDAAAGEKIFVKCKTCHTLKAAGATGEVGPNLDKLQPSADLVIKQVNSGGGAMPSFKGKLSDAQIKAVADYAAWLRAGHEL